MNDLRKYITILETAGNDELQKYRDEVKYWQNEREKYWPVSKELMAQYRDESHNIKDRYGYLYWQNKNNKLHRDNDKPAIIMPDGSLRWYQNNQVHRDGDKPARIFANGDLVWCQNDKWHRDGDKPAIIGASGALEWYQNGKIHRFRGPAVIRPDGRLEWYWRGEEIPVKSQEEFIEWMKKHKGLQRFRVNKP